MQHKVQSKNWMMAQRVHDMTWTLATISIINQKPVKQSKSHNRIFINISILNTNNSVGITCHKYDEAPELADFKRKHICVDWENDWTGAVSRLCSAVLFCLFSFSPSSFSVLFSPSCPAWQREGRCLKEEELWRAVRMWFRCVQMIIAEVNESFLISHFSYLDHASGCSKLISN